MDERKIAVCLYSLALLIVTGAIVYKIIISSSIELNDIITFCVLLLLVLHRRKNKRYDKEKEQYAFQNSKEVVTYNGETSEND